MTTDINIYSLLLFYSVIAGAFLKLIRDSSVALIEELTAFPQRLKAKLFPRSIENSVPQDYKKTPDAPPKNRAIPLLLQNTATNRALLRHFYPPIPTAQRVAAAILDTVFGIVCAITVVLLLFGLNLGELRWFVLPITAIGYLLYGATLGHLIHIIAKKLLSIVSVILASMLGILLLPIIKGTKMITSKLTLSACKPNKRVISPNRKKRNKNTKKLF